MKSLQRDYSLEHDITQSLLFLALTLIMPPSEADKKGHFNEKTSVTNAWAAATGNHEIHDAHQMS